MGLTQSVCLSVCLHAASFIFLLLTVKHHPVPDCYFLKHCGLGWHGARALNKDGVPRAVHTRCARQEMKT